MYIIDSQVYEGPVDRAITYTEPKAYSQMAA
jgi:hypothetical protein